MLAARLTPASRFLPSSVSRNLPSASTRRTISNEIVLAFEREHRIDEIVPRALLAQLDFQAVGEEGEEVASQLNRHDRGSDRTLDRILAEFSMRSLRNDRSVNDQLECCE